MKCETCINCSFGYCQLGYESSIGCIDYTKEYDEKQDDTESSVDWSPEYTDQEDW